MSTKCQFLPSRRNLLLRSTFAFVVCATISTAFNVAKDQRDQHPTRHPETVPKEERVFNIPKDAFQMVMDFAEISTMRLFLDKEKYVDDLLHAKIDTSKKNVYNTREFVEVAEKVIHVHVTKSGAMASLFGGLLRAKKAAGLPCDSSAFDDLVDLIVHFKGLPEQHLLQSAVVSRSSRAIDDFDRLRSIVMELEPPLLHFWRSEGLTPKKVAKMLNVDVTSSSMFENSKFLLWVDFVQEYAYSHGNEAFDLVVAELRASLGDFGLATRLLDAGADSKPGSVAESIMRALFRCWTMTEEQPDVLLRKLVPTLERGILKGPLKLWIKHFEPSLHQELYPTLVRTLLHPDGVPSLSSVTSDVPRNVFMELALVDIIATEWAKELDLQSSATDFFSASPLATPIFIALGQHWKKHDMTWTDVAQLLQLEPNSPPRWIRARRRALQMYAVIFDDATSLKDSPLKLTEMDLAELAALVVDTNERVYQKVSGTLFKEWAKMMKTKEDVFADLNLQSSAKGLFQNRLFIVWYHYPDIVNWEPFVQIMWMRDFLERKCKGLNLELVLQKAVYASEGKLQRILFELLVIRLVAFNVGVMDVPYIPHFHPAKMKMWYRELLNLPRGRMGSPPSWRKLEKNSN